jgi:hypothetical protein
VSKEAIPKKGAVFEGIASTFQTMKFFCVDYLWLFPTSESFKQKLIKIKKMSSYLFHKEMSHLMTYVVLAFNTYLPFCTVFTN